MARSRSLDGSQICGQSAGILAAKAKRRHVGMAADQAVAQSIREAIEVDAPAELAEGGRGVVRARSAVAGCVAPRAHSLGERAALALQRPGSGA